MDSGRLYLDALCHGNMFLSEVGDPVLQGPRSLLNMEKISKRRTFFSFPDELIDGEFYDEQSPEKKRRLTPEQVQLLEKNFELDNKLEPDRKTQLARKLGLQPRQIAIWFQNRRARWKNKQLERDYDLLKASYDNLLSNYNTIVKENEQLKSEVISFTEKLQAKEMAGMVVAGQKSSPTDDADLVSVHSRVKAEDHLSSGSGGSAVLDEDGPQLVDSGDSDIFADDYHGCMAHVHGLVQSEEEEGSEDGRSYFTNVVTATQNQQQHERTEPLDWCVWS